MFQAKARITSDERRNPKPIVFQDGAACNGMRYEWRTKVAMHDGDVSTTPDGLSIRNDTQVTLAISAATSFNGIDKCPDKDGRDESAEVEKPLAAASTRNFSQLKQRHIADYQSYYRRVKLALGSEQAPAAPIDERLRRYKAGQPDPALEQLYFQYGRYLLISSSRPGGFPANLQGIWNHMIRPSWRSNYTTNINVQMNYWPAAMTI